LDADSLDGLNASAFWQLGGTAGTTLGTHFLGTTDNQSVEFKVNNIRGLRLEPTASVANLIGGYHGNVVGTGYTGSTIGGGGAINNTNRVYANSAVVAGGMDNGIGTNAHYGAVGGGMNNSIATDSSSSVIAGCQNNAIGTNSLLSGISGGYRNSILDSCFGSTIAGGAFGIIGVGSLFATIGGGTQNEIQAGSSRVTIGGGDGNTIQIYSSGSTISGGQNNTIQTNSDGSTIAGGTSNMIQTDAYSGAIGGGSGNKIETNAPLSTIGGGGANVIRTNAICATIPGGFQNTAGSFSLAAGRNAGANHAGSFVWADSIGIDFATTQSNQFLIRASGGVGIGTAAPANPLAVEGGGSTNGGVIGFPEVMARFKRTGSGHTAVSMDSLPNQDAILYFAENSGAVWGLRKDADAGQQFQLRHHRAAAATTMLVVNTNGNVGIGETAPSARLHVTSAGSAVPQMHLEQTANNDFARLRLSSASKTEWTLAVGGANNVMNFFSAGGNGNVMTLTTNGNLTTAGTVNGVSDRAAKENFMPIDNREVLEKVATLPLARWQYKTEPGVSHLGPVAQDFYSAFGLGADDKHIATVDADGVALAAIQGLNQKLEKELQARDEEIGELKQTVSELKQLVRQLADQKYKPK
jgi:hypothetical protein